MRNVSLVLMVVTVLILTMLSASLARGAPVKPTSTLNEKLINGIIQVESNGDDKAIGDNGAAVGCLQIHEVMVDDVNRILGKQEYTYNDRLNRDKSIGMLKTFTDHYSPGASAEVICRRWNGGPKGDSKACTKLYWRKVQRQIE